MNGNFRIRRLDDSRVVVAGCCLVAAALRLTGIGRKSLWLDEAYSVTWARLSPRDLWHALSLANVHPPLYFALLHLFIVPFGTSEHAIRSLSALFGIATIPLVYAVGRRIDRRRTGTIAALLVAISPWQIAYAQQARMYTLLTFWATLAIYGLTRMLDAPSPEPAGTQPAARRLRAWGPLAYVGGTAGALWTHNIAVFLLAAANVVALFYWIRGRVSRRFVIGWLLAQLAALALWSPWVATLTRQAASVYADYWIPMPTIGSVVDILRDHYAAYLGPDLADGIGPLNALAACRFAIDLLTASLLATGIWTLARRRRLLALLLMLWLLPFIGILIVSVRRPILLDRTVLWGSIPFTLLLASGMAAWRPAARTAALTLLGVANVVGFRNLVTAPPVQAWREAANYVAAGMSPSDLVVQQAFFTALPFDYYFRPHQRAASESGIPRPFDFYMTAVLRQGIALSKLGIDFTPSDIGDLSTLVSTHRHVWLVSSDYTRLTDSTNLVPCVLARLGAAESFKSFREISVSEYRVGPSASPAPLAPVTPLDAGSAGLDSIDDQAAAGTRLTVPAGGPCLVVRGWALDRASRALAGGVELDVDGRSYPAFYGTERDDIADRFGRDDLRFSGYQAFVPDLTPGVHRLTLRVLSPDRRVTYVAPDAVQLTLQSQH